MPLDPIPTSGVRRWAEFRCEVLPAIVCLATLALAIVSWRHNIPPAIEVQAIYNKDLTNAYAAATINKPLQAARAQQGIAERSP